MTYQATIVIGAGRLRQGDSMPNSSFEAGVAQALDPKASNWRSAAKGNLEWAGLFKALRAEDSNHVLVSLSVLHYSMSDVKLDSMACQCE